MMPQVGMMKDLKNVKVDGSGGDAINVERSSSFVVLNHVKGSGNAGIGINASKGAVVEITSVATTITATIENVRMMFCTNEIRFWRVRVSKTFPQAPKPVDSGVIRPSSGILYSDVDTFAMCRRA
jgi:hypothetical protein